MPKPVYLHTLAQAATMAETTVAAAQRHLDEIGAQPTLIVNLTPFYSAEVVGTLIARVKNWSNLPAFHKTFFDEIQADV